MDKLLVLIFALYFAVLAFGFLLDYLNIRELKRRSSVIPPEFEGKIDPELLKKVEAYTIENTRFGAVASVFNTLILLVFFFLILDPFSAFINSLGLSFIPAGIIFFLALYYADAVISIPFGLYHTFVIEKKYGFSTMTPALWLADFLKSLVISTVLFSLMTAAGLWAIEASPNLWWLWVWIVFLLISIFLMYLSPYVIEPLFNKFEPVEDSELIEGIRRLMEKVGLKVKRVFKMDASRRTKHTNAYFTGIGHVKRIVLYDTLMEKLQKNEILSVLAHEIAHWKKKHVLKHIVVTEAVAIISFYISFRLLQGDWLNDLFNISNGSFFTKLIVLAFIGSLAMFPLGPLMLYLSRKHEVEADLYSYELTKDASGMINALVKLSKDNFSNIHPHPLYVRFHYSHPPVAERIRRIEAAAESNPTF